MARLRGWTKVKYYSSAGGGSNTMRLLNSHLTPQLREKYKSNTETFQNLDNGASNRRHQAVIVSLNINDC